MSTRATIGLLLGVLAAAPAIAQERLGDRALFEPAAESSAPSATRAVAAAAFRVPSTAGASLPSILAALTDWLSQSLELPPIADPPHIEFSSPARIASLRYGGLVNPGAIANADTAPAVGEVVAVYNDATRTIYLPEGWTGTSPAEMSVLVQELVHHLQNLQGMKFSCPQEREKLAYEAQEKWLTASGTSLSEAFDLDPFSVFAKSLCMR